MDSADYLYCEDIFLRDVKDDQSQSGSELRKLANKESSSLSANELNLDRIVGRTSVSERATDEMAPEYLTVEQAARLCQLHPHAIYNWISQGRIGKAEGARKIGRARRIHWPSFQKYIDRRS